MKLNTGLEEKSGIKYDMGYSDGYKKALVDNAQGDVLGEAMVLGIIKSINDTGREIYTYEEELLSHYFPNIKISKLKGDK